jgi:Flp pilus assembly protein TadG
MANRRAWLSQGQSTVELALVLIPLLLVIMGIFDMGRAVLTSHLLAGGAREGARVGISAARTADQICSRAAAAVPLGDVPPVSACGAAGPLTVAVLHRGTAGAPDDPVEVTLRYEFRPITPLVSQVIGGVVVLTASSSMYVEL